MSDGKEDAASKPDELQSGLSKTQCKRPNSHFGNILILLKKKAAKEKNFGMRSKCEESLFEYPAAETDFDAQVSVPRNTVTDMSSIPDRQEPAMMRFSIDEAPTGEKNQISSDGVNEGQLKKSNTPKSSAEKLVQNNLRDSCKNLFTSPTNQVSRGAQNRVTKLLTTEHATNGTQNGRQVSTQRVKRKRSKSPIRERSLASLLGSSEQWANSTSRTGTVSRAEQNIEILNDPLIVPTKKCSKRSMLINSTVQNMYNHQNIAGTSMGLSLALKGGETNGTDSVNKTMSYTVSSDVTHNKEAKTLQEFEDGTIREAGSIQEGYLRGESIDIPLGFSQTPDISVVKLLNMANIVLHGIKSDKDNIDNPTVPAKTITSCSQSSLCGVPKPGAHQTVEGNLVETEKFGIGDFDAQVRMPTNTIKDRSSIPASHLLDLNAPPKMIMDAVLRRRTSQVPRTFGPIP